ncbi:MAG: DUF882 domain-containing protein [Desmonostoc vinosum HA7617-LM4]|jgi:putative chitinase|nr:DUF882 domain-containing protein [Desmonostoc vinosum HA7617-LM4]
MSTITSEKFLDFWKYFDATNPKHINAVAELYKYIPSQQLTDESNWIRIYRTPIEAPKPPAANKSIAAYESVCKPYSGIVDWNDMNCKVSQYFTVAEVTQKDRRRIPTKGSEIERNILALVVELDKIRQEWGVPIGVTSWYRPPLINAAVGGVANSQHINGGAIDIYTMDGREVEFECFLKEHWGGGLGYGVASGKGFTHLDLRGGGWRRGAGKIRWNY